MKLYAVRYDHYDYGQGVEGIYRSMADARRAVFADVKLIYTDERVPEDRRMPLSELDEEVGGDGLDGPIVTFNDGAENYWYISEHDIK